jgi:hypothetical protein
MDWLLIVSCAVILLAGIIFAIAGWNFIRSK